MNLDPVAAVQLFDTPGVAAQEAAHPQAGFASWFAAETGKVNTQLVNADHDMQQLALGQTQNLHEVMIRLEEARLSFQLLVQVRNRLLEAYQDVMRTQV
jgi:flagellar hook-basal body complex protein FliE